MKVLGISPLDKDANASLVIDGNVIFASGEERYSRRSTVITSQLPIDRWHEVIGDPTYADAILDRLVHNAHRIELAGESLRRTKERQTKKA